MTGRLDRGLGQKARETLDTHIEGGGLSRLSVVTFTPGSQLESRNSIPTRRARRGWVRQVYEEKTSGADKSRPEFEKCLDILQDGDTLVVWRLDGRHRRAVWDLEGDLVPVRRA